MKDIIKSQITAADRTAVETLLGNLESALAGKTGTLDAEERTRYGSVSEQNKLVVNKAREYRQSQPAMSAPDVDWTEFESDYQSRTFLENVINRLNAIVHVIRPDTAIYTSADVSDGRFDVFNQ